MRSIAKTPSSSHREEAVKPINGLAALLGAPGFIALPAGTEIGGFKIDAVTSATSLDICYTATRDDDAIGYMVVEHFPRPIAFRDRVSDAVVALDPNALEQTRASFLGEAKALLQPSLADHTGAVAALEANDTAYAVFADPHTSSLRQWLAALGRNPEQVEVDRWLHPLLDALEALHNRGIVHGALSLDNVRVGVDGTLALTGFELARQTITSQLRASLSTASFGMAYSANNLSGPAADIFALGTVLRSAIAGTSSKAKQRETYSPKFLAMIEAALQADKSDGPKTLACLQVLSEIEQSSSAKASPSKRTAVSLASQQSITGAMAIASGEIFTNLRAARGYAFVASTIIVACAAVAVATHQLRDHIVRSAPSKTATATYSSSSPASVPLVSGQTDPASPAYDANRLTWSEQPRRAAEREQGMHDLGIEVDVVLHALSKRGFVKPVAAEQEGRPSSEPIRRFPSPAIVSPSVRSVAEQETAAEVISRDGRSRSEPTASEAATTSGPLAPAPNRTVANDQSAPGPWNRQSSAIPAETAAASKMPRDYDPR